MKFALRWCVVPLLATTLVAQTATQPKSKKAPVKSGAVTAQDVQALRDALAAQQQQIEQLRQQLTQRDQNWQQTQQQLQQAQTAATDAQQKADAAQTAATAANAQDTAQQDSVAKLNADLADVKTALTDNATNTQEEQKRMSSLESLVGRFRFNGDVRVRGESFFQDCPTPCADRNRARIRVRFGFDGRLNEDFIAGLSLATGSLGDPTSTNETLTNFFDRKTIGLDRGFITYNPLAHRWVSVTAGKFAYTWNRTAQTFDSDLSPEGFSEKFSFDLNNKYVKNVTGMLMQIMYNEASTGTDSYALGGQVSGRLQIGRLTSTPSFTWLKWNNPDAILNASLFSVASNPGEGPGCQNPSGVTNPPNCVFAPNKMTNATYKDAAGSSHFYSQFDYLDFILNNQIKTPWARLPINLLAEYANNLDAKDHPLDSDNKVATNLGKQSHLYLVDIGMGQLKNKNDIQFGYSWLRQEQDSVLASFDESDQRAPTNVLQNRIYALWKVRTNITAAYTFWFGHTLNTSLQHAGLASGVTPGESDPDLKRMQFDLIYTF